MAEQKEYARLHDKLKDWLIYIAGQVKNQRQKIVYKAWSGDSKPEDIRIKKRHIEYNPDVIWKDLRTGEKCVFEIAFADEWRAIAGEICLASMVEDCSKIFIITYKGKTKVNENFVSIISQKVELRKGAEAIFVPTDFLEKNQIGEVKKVIMDRLKQLKWVW